MKKIFISLLMLLPFAVPAQKATIRIDTERPIGEIDPNIYGVFMEPIGRDHSTTNIVVGPLYDPSSPTANKDGFNTVIIDAMKELKITNMRWPGGNYLSSYNWQDGIGPKEQRPVRKDLAWGSFDTNVVGTDEWVALNRAIGCENVICVNLGLGDINGARFWVEYCNLPVGTYYSDLRAKYGNSDPFNVKYWCIGNELDGEPWINGYKNADDYCKIGLEAVKAMKNVDNKIKTVACGSSYYEPTGRWIEWNQKIVNAFTGVADYLSIHRYWGERLGTDYYEYLGDAQLDFEDKIRAPKAQIKLAESLYPEKRPLMISVDEWSARGPNMRGVMANVMCLNSFIRHSNVVKMANFTMMTSLLSNDREGGYFKSPWFYAFKLFSNNCIGTSIDTYVQCDTFNTKANQGIPYLDVTSVYNKEKGSVIVNVVNRHADKSITTDISNVATPLTGRAQISSLEGDAMELFTYAKKDSYTPQTKQVDVKNGILTYTFPAHSVTQIELKTNPKNIN